jgi:hypothetical protein
MDLYDLCILKRTEAHKAKLTQEAGEMKSARTCV